MFTHVPSVGWYTCPLGQFETHCPFFSVYPLAHLEHVTPLELLEHRVQFASAVEQAGHVPSV
ncbi:MAG: hypothetical protein J5716_02795 [Alphaproteobacteria bacterium]|nr:hypothetical protein [Alphaproteobacteria bacterium]